MRNFYVRKEGVYELVKKLNTEIYAPTGSDLHNIALPKRGFTTEETAEILGISPASVMRLRKRGLLRPSLALRRPIYGLMEIERFLAATSTP